MDELCDELLLKILSLVPTKVAVSTSILSKRWEYLWMWLPKLEYGHRRCSEPESEKLRCFLDRNLPLHRAPVIESFRLELCSSRFKPENISMWVVVALSHCLRELEIVYETYPAKSNILPSNLFTCKSLVTLKLVGEILLDVPRMVSLPSLKTLKLQRVRYLNDDETLQRLLSNCPVLEDLVVKLRDYGDNMEKLTVVVPSLQSLSLFIPFHHDIYDYVMETPNLKYLKLVDYNDHYHVDLIENMPNLIEAYVDCCFPDTSSLIHSITSVKHLAICSESILDGRVTLAFDQLEHLEVCLCTVIFSNQLVCLLNASSKLKRLDITLMDDHDPHQGMDEWSEPSSVPECMLSSLQSLSWSSYTGKPQERAIVGYILRHAVYLKTATIKFSESDVQKFERKKELALSTRASAACELMFE